jgi:hypothetical protein
MFSLKSGHRSVWSAKDPLRSGHHVCGRNWSNNEIDTLIYGFSFSGNFFLRTLWVRALALSRESMILAGLILFSGNTALATPAFVQANCAVPQSPQNSVTVPYTEAQEAADLNVVVIGWNDTTAQISSVTDSTGNVYQLVTGPIQITGNLSQSIFCAKNIAPAPAGANAVTVNFTTAASHPDIRTLEYSGVDPLNPVDVFVGATGNSTTTSSGAIATTNATDLLVGANTVSR